MSVFYSYRNNHTNPSHRIEKPQRSCMRFPSEYKNIFGKGFDKINYSRVCSNIGIQCHRERNQNPTAPYFQHLEGSASQYFRTHIACFTFKFPLQEVAGCYEEERYGHSNKPKYNRWIMPVMSKIRSEMNSYNGIGHYILSGQLQQVVLSRLSLPYKSRNPNYAIFFVIDPI